MLKKLKPIDTLGTILHRERTKKLAKEKNGVLGYGDQTMYVDFHIIKIRPDFNWRRPSPYQTEAEFQEELEIPELAKGIYSNNGPYDPIEGDLIEDSKGKVHFYITEGQRRYLAISYNLKNNLDSYPNGEAVAKVLVRRNPLGMTEEARMKRIYTSQKKMHLKISQKAAGFLQYKMETGKTHEQIAEDFDVSRQQIDNMIKLNDCEPDILKQLDNKDITQEYALRTVRKQQTKVETKAAIKAEEKARTTSKTTPEPRIPDVMKDENQSDVGDDESYDRKEANKLIKEIIGNQDSMNVIINNLPTNLKSYKKDLLQYNEWNESKLKALSDLLEKFVEKQ